MRGTSIATPIAAIWAIAFGALAVSACKPSPAPLPAPKPAAPLVFTQTTPDATVRLAIAPAIASWPDLHKKLYDAGVAELRKDVDTASSDRAHLSGQGFPNPAYEQDIAWNLAAHTPRLVSLKGTWMSYTGGAHPNNGFNTLVWDIKTDVQINRNELLAPPGAGDAAVQTALCEGVRQARIGKGVEAGPDDEKMWPCPSWRASAFVLARSTTAGKFGGLTFVFDPYAIGSYAEGPYEITVPYAAIKDVLAPAYAAEFAGAPIQPTPAAHAKE